MARDERGRGTESDIAQKQPRGGSTARARSGNGQGTDAWLASVEFGTIEAKTPVNIRLDAHVVRFSRAGGPGYQTRINEVLKAFVQAQIRSGDVPGAPPKPRRNGRKRAK